MTIYILYILLSVKISKVIQVQVKELFLFLFILIVNINIAYLDQSISHLSKIYYYLLSK